MVIGWRSLLRTTARSATVMRWLFQILLRSRWRRLRPSPQPTTPVRTRNKARQWWGGARGLDSRPASLPMPARAYSVGEPVAYARVGRAPHAAKTKHFFVVLIQGVFDPCKHLQTAAQLVARRQRHKRK